MNNKKLTIITINQMNNKKLTINQRLISFIDYVLLLLYDDNGNCIDVEKATQLLNLKKDLCKTEKSFLDEIDSLLETQ